jgi:hypothetical protein
MKKLISALILGVFCLWRSGAGATLSTVSALDSTTHSLTLLADFAGVAEPESGTVKWKLWGGPTNRLSATPTTMTLRDSSIAIYGKADTSKEIIGLHNGTEYEFQVQFWGYDTTTAAPKLVEHWTASVYCTTKTIGQTIAAVSDSTTYRNFQIVDTYFGQDSAFKLIAMQYKPSGTDIWLWMPADAVWGTKGGTGRDSTYLASPDTLNAKRPPLDLLPGTTYFVRVLAYDSLQCDTSNTLTITTSNLPGYSPYWAWPQGEIAPGLYHFSSSWNSLNSTYYSPWINVTGATEMIIDAQFFGMDNNHNGDSSKVWLQTDRYGNDAGYFTIDSVIGATRPCYDTITVRKSYTLQRWAAATVADTVFANALGSQVRLYRATCDSCGTVHDYALSPDTTTLDTKYGDYWITVRRLGK